MQFRPTTTEPLQFKPRPRDLSKTMLQIIGVVIIIAVISRMTGWW